MLDFPAHQPKDQIQTTHDHPFGEIILNTSDEQRLKDIAIAIFNAGVQAVDPQVCLQRHLRLVGDRLGIGREEYSLTKVEKLYVVGIGKASASMMKAVEEILGDRIDYGLVVTKYGHGTELQFGRILEAGHPIPDENGVDATASLLDLVGRAEPKDMVLCLISGGGSALSPAPVEGIDLAAKQEITRQLLSCGATIQEINTIRKHLSGIKGGRFCQTVNGAIVVSLILSDVIGDDLDTIASGITVPDPSTFNDCLKIIDRYSLNKACPQSVKKHFTEGCKGKIGETPKPGDPIFDRVYNHIIGNLSQALFAAENKASELGFSPLTLTSMLQGEAAEVAKVIGSIAKEVRRSGRPVSPPACLLFGGETTVTIKGDGLGGRNTELALASVVELSGSQRTLLLSAGTDGTDGLTDAAGAFVDGSTLSRAIVQGLSPRTFLTSNDSYRFFEKLGELFITGPTRTNVMDLQIVVIDA